MKKIRHLKLIALGDVVAKIGRATVHEILPRLIKKYRPDAIIANVENLAHGKGVTEKTLAELKDAGVTVLTGGNHVWKKDDPSLYTGLPLALPANDPRTKEQNRWVSVAIGSEKIFVLNLLGQVNMFVDNTSNPFLSFDTLYESMGKPKLLVVDLHSETTSEKVAFGHYVDGRASLIYGTHTHVPTADSRILTKGTGYRTDLGMTGSNDSVLGVDKQIILKRFLTDIKDTFEYPETGPAWLNGLYAELDVATGKCVTITPILETLTIK